MTRRTAIRSVPVVALALMSGLAFAGHKPNSPLEFKVKDISGNEVDLAKYKGDVILIVNVASKCGLTPQYEALEETLRASTRPRASTSPRASRPTSSASPGAGHA